MKRKHLMTVLLVLVVCFALCLCAVACGDNTPTNTSSTDDGTTTDGTTETLLITNGRFEAYTDSSAAPYAPSSWTGTSGDTTKQSTYGVVPMSEDKYNAAKSAWDDLLYPTNVPDAKDNNHALLIYNKESNVYSYSPSSNFSTSIGAYYKFTVQFMVKDGTVGITDGSGAYVTFSGDAYHRFGPFAQTDAWQTVTLYVEASQLASKSIKVALSLGVTGNPTTGYVFFDNMLAEKITAKDYNDATESDTCVKYSMLVPDGDFINSTSTDGVQSPAIWSGKSGTGSGSTSKSDNVKSGIVDTVNGWDAWKDLSLLSTENVQTPYDIVAEPIDALSDDGKVLAISNEYALSPNGAKLYEECFTAYGYTNSMGINIAPGTMYELSVWVYTDLKTDEEIRQLMVEATDLDSTIDHSKYGANIILDGYGDYAFSDINTNKSWQKYTFIVLGSTTRYKEINVELWLGKGGTNDATRAHGTVYFDNLTLTELGTFTDRAQAESEANTRVTAGAGKTIMVSITDDHDEMIDNGNFDEGTVGFIDGDIAGWTLAPLNGVLDTDTDVKRAILDVDALKAEQDEAVKPADYTEDEKEKYQEAVKEWWQNKYSIDANPLAPHSFNYVLMINNVNPSAYTLRTADSMEIVNNLHYRVAVWFKTTNIVKSKGITIALMDADSDTSLSSFTTLNTADYENEMPDINGYVELCFYIKGSNNVDENSATDNKKVYLQLTFGGGNNFDTSSFLSGQVFVANVNMQQIDASEYEANTSSKTYSKAYSFASDSSSTSGAFADGKFDMIDYDESKVDTSYGTQIALFTPAKWTVSSVSNLKAGILNINQAAFVDQIKTETAYDFGNVYNQWADSVSDSVKADYLINFGAPNVFVAYTTSEDGVKAAKVLSNSSYTVSLSNNKYYIIRCYVRGVGTKGTLQFSTTGNKESSFVTFGSTNVDDSAWEEVCFAVETGSFGSISATINLYFGEYDSSKKSDEQAESKGIIFADSFTCYTIDEKTYTAFVTAGSESISYTTDTFDKDLTNITGDDLKKTYTPSSSWSGSGSSHTKVVGIYNKNYTTTQLQYLVTKEETDEEGNTKTTSEADETKDLTAAELFTTDGLTNDIGNSILVINNQDEGYYTYKSSSFTLNSNTAYKLTLDARTFYVEEGKFAVLRVNVDSNNYDIAFNSEHVYKVDEAGNYVKEEGVNVFEAKDSAWGQYTFYIQNTKSSSVTATLSLMLGMSATDAGTENSAPVQGTALFDNVSIVTIDAEAFAEQYGMRYVLDEDGNVTKDDDGNDVLVDGSDKYLLTNAVIRLADEVKGDTEENGTDNNQTEETKTDSSLIWLYITSIVIAAMLIVVIVVWLIRRYMPKNLFKRKKKITYDRNNLEEENGKPKKTIDTTESDGDSEFRD